MHAVLKRHGEGQALALREGLSLWTLRSYGPFLRVTAESIDIKVLADLKPKQDFQDIQDSQDFLSPPEQDQAILRYRVGWCMAAPVVRDRLIANGSRSGNLDLQKGWCGGGRRDLLVSVRFLCNRRWRGTGPRPTVY